MGASDVGATPRGCPVCPRRRCTRGGDAIRIKSDGGDAVPPDGIIVCGGEFVGRVAVPGDQIIA